MQQDRMGGTAAGDECCFALEMAGGWRDFTKLQQSLFDQDRTGEAALCPPKLCKQYTLTSLRGSAAMSLTS